MYYEYTQYKIISHLKKYRPQADPFPQTFGVTP